MTTKYVQRGDIIDYTPTVDVASNQVIALGVLLGVAVSDIPANTTGALAIEEAFDLPKKAGTAIGVGQPVTWSVADGALIAGAGVAGDLAGGAVSILPAAAGDTTVRVKLVPGLGKIVAG
jgi:predicted RecA/RadA family phage recombinase